MMSDFRSRLLASTLFVGVAVLAAPAFAQTQDPATGERETSDIGDPTTDTPGEETIVVTGSRIASPTLNAASPLQIVDAQDIDDSGTPNIQSVLLENPVFGTPAINRTNSNFSTSSAGVATVDLRNLGSDRTLLLVDGRRFVAGIPGSATVDLNTIPAQFIERIDILTGGASAVYGSDAVAGVVNIIYKKTFEGIEVGGQMGISEEGDDAQKQANLTMGGNFADGRGNVIAYAGYTKEGAVFSRDRRRSAIDQISIGAGLTGDIEEFFDIQSPFFSGFNPRGTLFVRPARDLDGDDDLVTPGEAAVTLTYDPVTGALVTPSTNGSATRTPTGYNRSAFRTIAIPTERYLLATRGNFEVDPALNFFVEGTYAGTKVATEIEPFPLDSAGANGIFPATGGRFAVENTLVNPVTGATSFSRNPLVPLSVFNQTVDNDGDGLRDIAFTRRLSDFGNRFSTVDRDTFRVVAGVNGAISDNWNYEASYVYGQTRESQFSNGQVNVLNFRNALDVVTDTFDLNGNGSTTDGICRDANARAQGCVPADVFNGANTLSPAAVRYIAAPSSLTSLTTQSVAAANVSGSLVELPAGPLGVSFGTEYRREAANQIFDALTNAGLNGGNRLDNTEGRFDVVEGYAEAIVPILADRPFFQELNLRGAGRVSDYSTVGTTYSYNYGLEYAPVEDIRFRAIRAQSTRAPNIGELFGGAGQTFPTGIVDPCLGVDATTGGTLGTQCRADAGVRANIATNGEFTINQADIQGVSGLNTSNPLLGEEEGKSWTLGVVINPRSIDFLRNFAFTVDYFDIKIADAITPLGRNFILEQCYNQANPVFCALITRRQAPAGANSAGSLDFVNSTSNNSGGLKTSGVDVTASYRQNLEDWGLAGNFNARVAWTHVIKGFVVPLPGEPKDDFNREIGASRNKVFGTVAYDIGDVGLTVRGNYIGPAFFDDQFLLAYGYEARDLGIKSKFYTDAQVRFTPGDNFEFYVGADNLFDVAPPPIITGLPGNTTGAETDAGTYDAIGRRFYAGARVKF